MKAQKILWLIMLSLLLIVEIILGLISCNPTSDFSGMATYTVQTQTVQGVSDNQTVSSAVKSLLSVLQIIFVTVIVLGAISYMGYRSD